MFVIATAGHVDHGKSTLVRALTGVEPDRWAEERRRGLTIDLGFAATTLPSGRDLSFVDVPGHERFLANMLAGVGPAPAVCLVVAADEGWQAQTSEHRDAIAAWGIRHGLLVVTKADRAPDRVAEVIDRSRAELAGTPLAGVEAVAVSAVTGAGIEDLKAALDRLVGSLPAPDPHGRIRLWVDRAFSIRGAGTVVTGTLTAGPLEVGQGLDLLPGSARAGAGPAAARRVTVRGLRTGDRAVESIGPTCRVAVNLRGVGAEEVHRGDALIGSGAWPLPSTVDVRRHTGRPLDESPQQVHVHVGTADVPARLRALGGGHGRLTLAVPLPLVPGDRLVLGDPGGQRILGGVGVLDVDPAPLTRRGDGPRRAAHLATLPDGGSALAEIAHRGAVRAEALRRWGLDPQAEITERSGAPEPAAVVELAGWWVTRERLSAWVTDLESAITEHRVREPLSPGLPLGQAGDVLDADAELVQAVLAHAPRLRHAAGYLRGIDDEATLGPAESAVTAIEGRLAADPFAAPEGDELTALGVGPRELAAAERAGRLLRLTGPGPALVLLPSAPALAMRELVRLPQPFTVSQARQAWGTSRRVAVPLLELLDARGWTRRVDGGLREVVR